MADQCDRLDGGGTGRIERVRAIRQRKDDIHFRTKVDKITRPLAACVPEETAFWIDGDRCKKAHAWRDISQAEADLGRGSEKVLMRVARSRSERGERGG